MFVPNFGMYSSVGKPNFSIVHLMANLIGNSVGFSSSGLLIRMLGLAGSNMMVIPVVRLCII